MSLRARKLTVRRPVHARRAIAKETPLEYALESPAPRWLIGLATVTGIIALASSIVGLVVIA